MRYSESVLDLIGNTPLVRLTKVTRGLEPLVLAKVEYFNPGGSVKDRIAVRMVGAAEQAGLLKPGGTIVEPTSGNTGIGLALVAQQRGYRCIFVCPDKVGSDKIEVLKAYGAEVVVCPTAVDPADPRSYYQVSDRLARDTPGGWKPDQYSNPENPRSHYETTGPEVWEQTDGRVTHLVAGVGTGGTISGAGRYLKERSEQVKVIGADPVGSVYSGGTGRPYLVEGVGEDFWPATFDREICDEIIAVPDATSFQLARRLGREEGLLVGGSCGLAVAAAIEVAKRGSADDVIVVLLPDSGRAYLSKVFSDTWMTHYGFMRQPGDEVTVAQVLAAKRGALPRFVHVHPNEPVRDAIDVMREFGVSQMPVLKAEPPVVTAEVVGSIVERDLLDALFRGEALLTDAIGEHMSPPLPTIGGGELVAAAVELLGESGAAVVLVDGKPSGVIARQDLLAYLGAAAKTASSS